MKDFEGSFESASRELAERVDGSVSASVAGHDRVAVAFSGGLDSSVLVVCAKRRSEVVACTAHSETSLDGRRAAEGARALGVELESTRLTPSLVSQTLKTIELPFEPSLMDRSLWCLYSVVSRSAAGAGAKVILLGQMADELFGGYSKYQAALQKEGRAAAEALMARDLAEYPSRGRVRDMLACSRFLPVKFPFESEEVVEFGLALPVSFKIRDGVRKAVLRRAATMLGVPEGLAGAPKKAAQYSSGIQKIIG